jgi:hypothetical protein
VSECSGAPGRLELTACLRPGRPGQGEGFTRFVCDLSKNLDRLQLQGADLRENGGIKEGGFYPELVISG